jgi:hypothetical protein
LPQADAYASIAHHILPSRYAEEYIGIFAANIPCLRALLQDAFRTLGGHITGTGSKTQTRTSGSKMHTLNSEHASDDLHQSTVGDGSEYHHYMQKDDVEMNGVRPGGQVLVTHHIETIVDKRSLSERWDSSRNRNWDGRS